MRGNFSVPLMCSARAFILAQDIVSYKYVRKSYPRQPYAHGGAKESKAPKGATYHDEEDCCNSWVVSMEGSTNFISHPLIHTALLFNLIQHLVSCQRLLPRCITWHIVYCRTNPINTAIGFKKMMRDYRSAFPVMVQGAWGGSYRWSEKWA